MRVSGTRDRSGKKNWEKASGYVMLFGREKYICFANTTRHPSSATVVNDKNKSKRLENWRKKGLLKLYGTYFRFGMSSDRPKQNKEFGRPTVCGSNKKNWKGPWKRVNSWAERGITRGDRRRPSFSCHDLWNWQVPFNRSPLSLLVVFLWTIPQKPELRVLPENITIMIRWSYLSATKPEGRAFLAFWQTFR
jgi:hypothetical protein